MFPAKGNVFREWINKVSYNAFSFWFRGPGVAMEVPDVMLQGVEQSGTQEGLLSKLLNFSDRYLNLAQIYLNLFELLPVVPFM